MGRNQFLSTTMAYVAELAPTNRCSCAKCEPSRDELTNKFAYLLSHSFVSHLFASTKGFPGIFVIYLTVITRLNKCHALVYVIPKWQTTREECESKVIIRNLEYINKFMRRHCNGKDGYFLTALFLPKQETFGVQEG